MTARLDASRGAWRVCCDATGCDATGAPSPEYRRSIRLAAASGWATSLAGGDPTVVDLCPKDRDLAGVRA